MSADMQAGAALGEHLWAEHFEKNARRMAAGENGPDTLMGLYVAAISRALGAIARDYGIDEARNTVRLSLMALDTHEDVQIVSSPSPARTQ